MDWTLLFSVFVLSVTVLDWQQWIPAPRTPTQNVIVMTSVFPYWLTRAVEDVYCNCFKTDLGWKNSYWIGSLECAKAISRQMLIFSVGLTQATGWWKHSTSSVIDMLPVETVTQLTIPPINDKIRLDDSYILIGTANNIDIYVPGSLAAQMVNDTVLAITHKTMFKRDDLNKTLERMPYTLMRLGQNGMTFHLLSPGASDLTRRLDNPNPPGTWDGLYTTGGSIWVECQYGGGLGYDEAEYVANQFGYVNEAAGEGHALPWRSNAYYGYIGADLSMKCSSKAFNYNTDNNGQCYQLLEC